MKCRTCGVEVESVRNPLFTSGTRENGWRAVGTRENSSGFSCPASSEAPGFQWHSVDLAAATPDDLIEMLEP